VDIPTEAVAESVEAPRRPGRPRDAARDEAILTAALELLQQIGYRDLTIEGIAERAGVSRPTIYRGWPSKPTVVVAALTRSTRLAVPPVDTGSLRGDLIALQRHRLDLMSTPQSRRVTAGLIGDLAADPDLAESYVRDYLAPRRAVVWEALQRGVDRGELDPDIDLAFAYDLLAGPLFMRAIVWGQSLPADMAEKTADVILAAFAPKTSSAPAPAARPAKRRRRAASS